MKYARVVLAIMFCLSEFYWADNLLSLLNPMENSGAQYEFVFILALIAAIITDRWTIGIGILAVYLGVVAHGIAHPHGDPQTGPNFHFWTAIYIVGPFASVASLVITVPVTLIRMSCKRYLRTNKPDLNRQDTTTEKAITNARKSILLSLLSVVFYGALAITPYAYFHSSVYKVSVAIPQRSLAHYDNNLSIGPTFAYYFPRRADLYEPRMYSSVRWEARNHEDADKCALSVIIDDQAWLPDDLEWEAFMKRGAMDTSVERAKGGITKPNPEKDGYYLLYYSNPSNLNIMCWYTPEKKLMKVTLTPGAQWYDELKNQPLGIPQQHPHPLKNYRITINERTLLLPTDEKTLLETLGPPLSQDSLEAQGSWPPPAW